MPGDNEPLMIRLPNQPSRIKISDCIKAIQKFETLDNHVVSVFDYKASCFELIARVHELVGNNEKTIDVDSNF